ncbi:MAG: hypothetical protein J5641_01110 [Bacteroidales bacterium]|nr:hypothetical protein [Bacteroidales bacterium]
MKNKHHLTRIHTMAAVAAAFCLALFSCQKENITDMPEVPPEGMYIADTVHYADEGITAYNIVYKSADPYGQPVMLSAAVVLADDIVESKHARGYLLYNHVTIFRADECPTRGNIAIEKKMTRSGLITVSADYYGFGTTEQMNQAYCMADANAQAGIDALLAAKKLLEWKGYTWDDNLFVCGYSQGGHTAMGVVRLVAEKYPDIDVTYTFAGGGPYNIPTTYRDMVTADIAGQPSTVVSVLLTYNQYYRLDIPRQDLFIEPLLSHIDDWVLSKRYSRPQIDSLIGDLTVSQFVTPTIMDIESETSQRIIEALEHDNLCKDWTPRGNENIMLFHNTSDITVPPSNTESLYQFLQQHGVDADLYLNDYGSAGTIDGHTVGALFFSAIAINKIAEILQIEPWSIF